MGHRASIALTCAIAGVTMSLAGYWNDRFLGGFSVFYPMINEPISSSEPLPKLDRVAVWIADLCP
jgi:hypothetical protein